MCGLALSGVSPAAALKKRFVPHILGANTAITGYGLFEASDLDDALAKAKGCPILSAGGSIEVAEAIDM